MQQPFVYNWSSIHIRTNYTLQNWSNILENFITILYDFEKQWLSTFAWKAIVVRPVQQNFICLVKDRHETFFNVKKCNDKDLIWHMMSEMVKKQGWARLFISCNYSCAFYFLVNILLVKLKNLHTSACLKLNYCITKHKPKM